MAWKISLRMTKAYAVNIVNASNDFKHFINVLLLGLATKHEFPSITEKDK